jgi:glutamate/tyrosine decarboxylase-like PLP-dependent enzyme
MQARRPNLDLSKEEFLKLGHQLVDLLGDYLENIGNIDVTSAEQPKQIKEQLAQSHLPAKGEDPAVILTESFNLLKNHGLHIGHPKFWGFICGSGLPIGWLAEFMATAFNPNLGGYVISPMATEIENQTVQWLADLIGYTNNSFGLLTSGGNMANMIPFWAARRTKAGSNLRTEGVSKKMTAYVSDETHTWIEKAADLSGIGTNHVRWIETSRNGKMKIDSLENQIKSDISEGYLPFIVVANAGSVSTGTVDPIKEIYEICQKYNIWLHADGAYGGVAAGIPGVDKDLSYINLADSIAIDPHKWLYCSVEAGCVLVQDKEKLRDTFSYTPPYYKSYEDEQDLPTDFHEFGPQNSRGFKALKVWMALRQAGKEGYINNLNYDIKLANSFFKLAERTTELEAYSQNLSICTFRYIPDELIGKEEKSSAYLNKLNEAILLDIQSGGEAFISNAVRKGLFLLRICIVNHRTELSHLVALKELVVNTGRKIHQSNVFEELNS